MKPNPIPVIAALLLFSFTTAAQDDSRYQLLLKNEAFVPVKNITADQVDLFNRKAIRIGGKTIALIQFEQLPSAADKLQLQQAGIELLDYIPNNAYTASITGSLTPALLTQVKARAIVELTPAQKMQPELARGNFPAWSVKQAGTIDVWLSFARTFSYETISAELRSRNFDIISSLYKEYRVIGVRLSTQRLNELASLPFIDYLEPAPHEDQPLNNVSRANSRANVLNRALGRNLIGQDITIGIGDNSDPVHVDFSGRRISRAAVPPNYHGTHVHGIAAGGGIWNELYMGYAPKARMISQAFSGILNHAPAYVTDYRMVITNNSYGNIVADCGYNGLYDLYSRIMDQQAFSLPNLQHVFAAGNSATGSGYPPCPPYPTDFQTVLGSYQSAKNVLTVGNTYPDGTIFPQSSRGPVKDGRIKPEIAVQGSFVVSAATFADYFVNTGTSMAAPGASGGLALLYQRYRQLNADADPPNALMKAILCNTATDRGNTGPDYTYGFGWMNLLRAVELLEATQYVSNTVSTGGNNSFNVSVPANTAQLKVMLYWNDPAAAAVSAHTLVNDLDLSVTPPSGPAVLPWRLDTIPANVNNPATTGADHINNIEQVTITNPAAGTYSVNITGTAIPVSSPQTYYVVYDIVPVSTTLTFPAGGEKLIPGETVVINWDSYGDPANTFLVEYSTNNGASWTTINASVAANLRQLSWVVPSVQTEQALVRINRNSTAYTSTSQAFTILGAPAVSLAATQCEGYIAINWTSVTGATDYEVMKLQGDEMVSETIVPNTTTSYTFSGLSKDSVYWVTVRARYNGFPGRRDTAVTRQPNSGICTGTISDLDLKLDAIVSPTLSGRKFTSTEFSASVPLTIRIKNLDDAAAPAGSITVSYTVNGGSPVNEIIVNPVIAAGGTLTHTFSTNINMSAVGAYQIVASVSQPGDAVAINNSLTKTFKQLDNPAISLLSPFLDNLEAGTEQTIMTAQRGLSGLDRYDFVNSTVYGRLRTFINTGIAYSGSKALTLDADRYIFPSSNVDSLTGTFNLGTYNAATDDIRMDFRYKNHGQASNAANQVWIRGNDQQPWVKVYDLAANQNGADGTYKLSSSIELSDTLSAWSQNFSSSFQVRWGQYGQLLAADDDGGAGYSFDDIRFYKVIDDVQLVSIDTPVVVSCNLTAATPVKITVRNNSNSAIPAVPGISVRFRVDGGAWTTETIAGLAANTSVQYTFTATANLAATGTHLLETQVIYPTDSYFDNDTASITLVNSAIVSSFPYLETFESSNGSWYSNGKNNSWEYGTPASYKINKAASGSKAWKTRVAGNYNDQEASYLYSPCFNISGMTVPTLSFSLAIDLEDCGSILCDGAYMEYSRDGRTWTRLGAFGQGTNWYNKTYNVWSKENYHRWHVATIPLPTTGDLTQLRLRFVVSADLSVNREGIAVDDIHIYDNIYGIYPGPTMTSPVAQTISGGTTWVDFLQGGKLVASVQPNNQNMGSTDAQAYINTGPVRFNSYQYYHDRNITIKPATVNLADSVRVRFYFLDSETETLLNAGTCGNCTKPASAYELGVTKYSDPNDNFENGTIMDDLQGTWLFINSTKASKVPFDKGYYAEFKVKDFSEFWLNNGGFDNNQPLPVQLMDFTATKKPNKDVLAEWTTASEFNVNRFEVELARGNAEYQQNHFVRIGQVNSSGNSTQEQHYIFTDGENNKSGVRYYRLKIIENDGSFSYSVVRPVVFNEETQWQVYPNPSPGIFNLDYQLNAGELLTIKLYDVNGRLVHQQTALANGFVQKIRIDLQEGFAPGLYLLEATTAEKKQIFKLIRR